MTTSNSDTTTADTWTATMQRHLSALDERLRDADQLMPIWDTAADTLTELIGAMRELIGLVKQQQTQLDALSHSPNPMQEMQDIRASFQAFFAEHPPMSSPQPVIASEQSQSAHDPLPIEDGWRELHSDLFSKGYAAGVPDEQCWQDAECFAEDRCPTCGGAVEFLPFVRRAHMDMMTAQFERGSYRAFVVCRGCDQYLEF